jgi:hypothetical protein
LAQQKSLWITGLGYVRFLVFSGELHQEVETSPGAFVIWGIATEIHEIHYSLSFLFIPKTLSENLKTYWHKLLRNIHSSFTTLGKSGHPSFLTSRPDYLTFCGQRYVNGHSRTKGMTSAWKIEFVLLCSALVMSETCHGWPTGQEGRGTHGTDPEVT